MSKSIKEIRLHGSSIDLRDPVKKTEESCPQTGIHLIPPHEDEDEQNNTPDKSDPQTETRQDSIEKNNTPDKKNKCASLLDKLYTSLRCLGIWVAVITLLFLTASVVCGVFLAGYIQTMQASLDDQQIYISSLKQELIDQQQINKDDRKNIQNVLTDLQKTVANQQITIIYQSANISSQSAIISQLQQEMSVLQHKTDTEVFFAARPSTHGTTVQGGQTVVYDHVITSMGGGYDSSTGIFQAQKSGYYRADVHALAQKDKQVNLGLKHNYAWVVYVWCDDDGGYNSCSNSATVRLNQGDSLKVVASTTSYLGFYDYNTFSVQLLSVV